MQENPNLMEDGRAEVTPKPLQEFLWKGIMMGIVFVILRWLLRVLENWRCPHRFAEEDLENSREIPRIQRDGQHRNSEEKTPRSSWKFFEEKLLPRSCKISDEKTRVSPCNSQVETFKERNLESASRIFEEFSRNKLRRISKVILELPLKPFGAKPLAELPLQKKDACERCRVSSVVHEVKLSIKGRRRFDADGPAYYLSCLVGNSTKGINSQVDTGCSSSAIDLSLVEMLGLVDQVDRSKRIRYEAMGGERRYTYGMLHVPVRTVSGFLLIKELLVVETDAFALLIGLDVLAVNNCSLILDVHRPILVMRERDACSEFKGFNTRRSADVVANINGVPYKSTLDTGTRRTVVPKSIDFAQESLSEPAYFHVCAKDPVRVSKKVKSLQLEINGCVGRVDPYVMSESHPMIGTDFLQNKRIDFIHGKVYVESLNF